MKSKIICLILFIVLLLFCVPANTFAQTSFESGPMFNPHPGPSLGAFIGLGFAIAVGQVFGFISCGFDIIDGPLIFDLNINFPIGITFDYEGKEPVKFYMFTPIMAGKYAKYSPRIELVNSFSTFFFNYSLFIRSIFPINIQENLFSIQPFIGVGFLTHGVGYFLIDTGLFFQISIVTICINYQTAFGMYIINKFLFKISIYF